MQECNCKAKEDQTFMGAKWRLWDGKRGNEKAARDYMGGKTQKDIGLLWNPNMTLNLAMKDVFVCLLC